MDTRTREKHLKHIKNSSLAPLLFGRRMYYSSKNFRWLRNLSLVPRQSFDSCFSVGMTRMSNRLIEVTELAEEIVDTVLSCLGSEQFVHSSYHTYKELEDCSVMEEALSVGKRNEFVSLMSSCFNGDHRLDKPGIELLSLAVLHQAIKYICQTWRPRDYLTKFEAELKRQEPACIELRLRGNDCFVAGDYKTAVIFYSDAITTSPFDPLLYGNRAQSFLKLKKLREALSDAKRAVYLNPEWEKGHYRFAQAYFELGFPEKAMAVNSLAQKCCSSTLNLLCQAVVFKREMDESSARNKAHCCSTSVEQTADKSHRHHQAAACGNPCSSRSKVGNKRNWKLANEKPGPHVLADEEDNCDTFSNKDQDSDCKLSDDDSLPALKNDSSDDCNDDDDIFNDGSSGDSDLSSLPSLASPCDSDTESGSESDNNLDIDGELLARFWDSDCLCRSGMHCMFYNRS
ncbi:hypothetical protein OS493_003702 [Desmophyllum pertusum]|uniref:Uncharacterized protein n=1 Tax=Desmophyllum pertusum TaxID=174260 RepID=A0A9X0A9I8_9CNID|nr:hypothetical protein OS493_003702 [Desmophyllum pertusum]